MQSAAGDPRPCPDCGHLVYRPLMLPVRRPQQSCRAAVPVPSAVPSSGPSAGTPRCGCDNAVHRLPTMRPRHRLEATG